MGTWVASRPENNGGAPSRLVCKFWLAGRCNRDPCRFLHQGEALPTLMMNPKISKPKALVWTREGSATVKGNNASNAAVETPCATGNTASTAAVETPCAAVKSNNASNAAVETPCNKVCKFWVDGNCANGDQCPFLHKWVRGDEVSMLARLPGHDKAITGIAVAVGCNKLYSAGSDGTFRIWDCNSGQCASVFSLGGQAGSLISEGPWVFVGLPNAVKAWNTETNALVELNGPVGQVHAVVVGNGLLFAGAQDGAITVWKGCSITSDPVAATLKGHDGAVLSLTVGANKLFSGSMDHSIRVWDLDSLQCVAALNGHCDAVKSLIWWDQFLISCSLDCTIKVWFAPSGDNFEETYSKTEEQGLLALSGTTDAENKPILLCSCNDNSVRLYELPSFTEKGRLFGKEAVTTLEVGPQGLFFSGDAAGLLTVWKWTEPGFKAESS